MPNHIFDINATITWIIPVYNGEKYILQAIDSILNQPCRDLQVLIVDDGSTDHTYELVSKIDDNRLKIGHKENGGVASARNWGLDHVFSDYITFLDSDDMLCKNAYDENINSILREKKYDMLNFSFIKGDQDLKWGSFVTVPNRSSLCQDIAFDSQKHYSSFIYRKGLLDQEDKLRFPEGMNPDEDVAFQFLVHNRAKNMLEINKNWFAYRNNITSITHKLNPANIGEKAVGCWYYAKQHSSKKKEKDYCDIKIASLATSFIQFSCSEGLPIEQIQTVLRSKPIQESMDNYDIFWNSLKKTFDNFNNNPQGYWNEKQKIVKKRIIIDFLKKIPLCRKIYYRKKYFTKKLDGIV